MAASSAFLAFVMPLMPGTQDVAADQKGSALPVTRASAEGADFIHWSNGGRQLHWSMGPTVYTAEIPAGSDERVVENNSRSVLVSPAGRKRRLLIVEGAPGPDAASVEAAVPANLKNEVDILQGTREDELGRASGSTGPARSRSRLAFQSLFASFRPSSIWCGLKRTSWVEDIFSNP